MATPKKRGKIVKPDTGPKFPVGTFALVLPPNEWRGFHCLIEAHRPEYHILRVTEVGTTSFLIRAYSDELQAV